jgi:hypothetical protein
MGRLQSKITNGLGNAKKDYPPLFGIRGDRVAGNAAGILIDGVITPLAGEPPVAKTNGWGRVPGTQ